MVKVNGAPLWIVWMPVNVQPPSIAFANPFENRIGGVYSHEATNACRRSQSERPRSSRRLNGFATVPPRLSVELVSIDFDSVYDASTVNPSENRLFTCAWKL